MNKSKAFESFLAFSEKRSREYLDGYPDVLFREMAAFELEEAKNILSSKVLKGDKIALMALFNIDESYANLIAKEVVDKMEPGLTVLTAAFYLFRGTNDLKYLNQALNYLDRSEDYLIANVLKMLNELAYEGESRSAVINKLKIYVQNCDDVVYRHTAAKILLEKCFKGCEQNQMNTLLKNLISDVKEKRESALHELECN